MAYNRSTNKYVQFRKEVYRMQITDIKVRKLFNDSSTMKAVVSVTFDGQLALHDIKVIYAKERYFIVMPSKKNADGTFRDVVHPINAQFRGMLESAVIDAYDKAVEEAAQMEETEDGVLVFAD